MNKLALLAVVVLAACQQDPRNNDRNLEKKIDDLAKKVDQLIARGGPGAAMPPRQARAEPDAAKIYAVPIEGDFFEGPADAKVTIVEAYDYACPFCERVRSTIDELRQKYGNDLRVVFKQLVVHPPRATTGALAVCAANKQGKFLEMNKLLWEKGFKGNEYDKDASENGQNVRCWESAAGCPIALGYAQQIGLNVEKVKADMKGECQGLVQKDQRELSVFGVSGTPAFFINGRYISGAQPIDRFVAVIDDELKKANDKIAAGTPQATYYQVAVLDKGLKQLDRPVQ